MQLIWVGHKYKKWGVLKKKGKSCCILCACANIRLGERKGVEKMEIADFEKRRHNEKGTYCRTERLFKM